MDIGLFDLYVTNHHIPYAKTIIEGLKDVSDYNVRFITLSKTDHYSEFFEQNQVVYLDSPDSPIIEDREDDFSEFADAVIEGFFSEGNDENYDVVHFLYADDILGPLWRHSPTTTESKLIVELNGAFFKRGTVLRQQHIHPLFLRMLSSPIRSFFDYVVPEKTTHEALWRDLYLYRHLDTGSFDHMLVHSREAEKYVSRVSTRRTNSIVNIPYPGPEKLGHEISKKEARERLGLQQDGLILLYFGVLRSIKGIDELLKALRQYEGPSFTILIAGPPSTVSEEDIRSTSQLSSVNIVSELKYIETPQVFYRAADALILPYTHAFGKECTSQTMFEACSALRPVIVPDFGAIGRITEEWDLGSTYEHGSIESIIESMSSFAKGELTFSEEQMKRFNQRHSKKQVATELVNLYSCYE